MPLKQVYTENMLSLAQTFDTFLCLSNVRWTESSPDLEKVYVNRGWTGIMVACEEENIVAHNEKVTKSPNLS